MNSVKYIQHQTGETVSRHAINEHVLFRPSKQAER